MAGCKILYFLASCFSDLLVMLYILLGPPTLMRFGGTNLCLIVTWVFSVLLLCIFIFKAWPQNSALVWIVTTQSNAIVSEALSLLF